MKQKPAVIDFRMPTLEETRIALGISKRRAKQLEKIMKADQNRQRKDKKK